MSKFDAEPRITAFLMLLWALMAPVAQGQSRVTQVSVDTVHLQPMSQTVPVIGRFAARQSGVVAARTEGPVERLQVDVGDHVQRGDVLAVLDQARLRARLALVEAELKELEAREATARSVEKLAKLELNRLERLRGSAAFNQSLYDERVQQLEVAQSNRREAQARIARGRVNLELAKIELDDSTIRAPFPGTVTLRHTNAGAWLDAGDSVVTLINDESLEIEADVQASYLDGLAPDTRISVLLDGGERYRARVRSVIPDENPAARTRAVRLQPEFGTTERPLAVNQPVTLMVPLGREAEVVSVHKDAVLSRSGRDMVFVVRDGAAEPRTVVLGEAVGSRFQVLEGLVPGDVVVIRGNERLRPGERVSYTRQPDASSLAADRES